MKTKKQIKEELWGVYKERNQLVLLLTKIYPSHLSKHTGKDWEDDWRTIVCVHTPEGQATWHIHDSEVKQFGNLAYCKDHWDGHTTPQKYRRLAKIKRPKELRLKAKNYLAHPLP